MDRPNTPSFFDIVAQESLKAAFPDFIHHLLRKARERYPQSATLERIQKHFDAFYLILDLAIQYLFLQKYRKQCRIIPIYVIDGTLTENYYGIQRVSITGGKFTRLQLLASLLETVLVPHAKRKFREAYLELGNEQNRWLLSKILPKVYLVWESSTWIMRFFHIYGDNPHLGPLMWLAGLAYEQGGSADEEIPVGFSPRGFVSGAMVLIRFLQWWYEQSGLAESFSAIVIQGRKRIAGKDIPVPPKPPGITDSLEKGVCPICKSQGWKTKMENSMPVALHSGLIYCRPCIEEALERDPKCPVTGIPAKVTDLRPVVLSREYQSGES